MNLQLFQKTGKGLVDYANAILDKHNGENIIESFLNCSTIPDHIKGQTALTVLKKLSKSRYFSICEIRDLAKMHNINFTPDHDAFFHSLHCTDWTDMTAETREYLMALIVRYFSETIEKAGV